MSERDNLAGNRFSLRSKPYNQIKRIDALSNNFGAIGEFLVSTWGGIMIGIVTAGFGAIASFLTLSSNGGATAIANIIPALLILIGSLALAINVIMTNPSMGSQLIVSVKFLFDKIQNNSKRGKTEPLRIFRLNDEQSDVLERLVKGRMTYTAVFSVRGTVSPVSFREELLQLERLNRQWLVNMERDTVVTCTNAVQKAHVEPIPLPRNATPAMVARRDAMYQRINTLRKNQQLKTTITIKAGNLATLQERVAITERIFNGGLVVGYTRLHGDDLKAEVKRIYD